MPKGDSTFGPRFIRSLMALAFLHFMLPSISWCDPQASDENLSSDDPTFTSSPSSANNNTANNLESLTKTEVVYNASDSEEKTTESPGSTTVITSTEIKVGGFRTLDDLLSYVRGFFINSDSNYTYVGLRGFGSLAGYNSRILLLVDGHRINDNIYGQFYSGEDAPVDMDTVDHVVIIRGPASILYGNSAVFGVINLITKKGKDVNGTILTSQGGSLRTIGGGVLYGKQLDTNFQLTIHASAYNSGGNASIFYPAYDSPSTNNGIAQNCDAESSQHLFISMDLEDWSLEGAFMNRTKTIPTGVYGTAFDDPNSYTDDTDFFTEIRYKHGDPETGQWLGRLSLDQADYMGNYILSGSLVPNIDNGDGQWASAELQYIFTPFSRNKITLGIEFVDNLQQFQENYNLGQSPPFLYDSRQSTQWSFYAQDEVKLWPTWFLSVGGRYDYFSQVGGQFVPRGALIWEPSQPTVLKFVAGEAFRTPDDYELYYQDDGQTQESNPNLKTETYQTYELDWEQTFPIGHRILFSIYHYLGGNLILGTQDPNNGLLVYENVGHISINGFETEYQYQTSGGIQGRMSWSLQRAQDDLTNQLLPDSPQILGKANLQVPIDAKHLTVSGECQYNGGSYGFNGFWAPAYTLFNLKFYSPHFIWDNVEANLDFYNLFNTPYYDPVGVDFQQLTLPQDGLVIWGRLAYKL